MLPEAMAKNGLPNLDRYVRYDFVQEHIDWYKNAGNGEKTYTSFGAHMCELDDFIKGEKQKELFDTWFGFYFICPNKFDADGNELTLLGDPAAMVTKSIHFDLRRCDSVAADPATECESKEAIDAYIADIQMDNWVVNKRMNFTDRIAEPSFMILDIFDS